MFDVVIVDEASQCGLDGLLLLYLGAQIVVVGDNEQISPTVISDGDQFRATAKRYISDYPQRDLITPDTSLFDLCEVWLGNRITLREHFRCMPEIIQFSNKLCYEHSPLVPLRQVSSGRLPPLRAVHVPNGELSGQAQGQQNVSEADAIIEQICEC
ncbi:MAG: AAA domain-containing protein, partial [Planctomycetaceae bacterium]